MNNKPQKRCLRFCFVCCIYIQIYSLFHLLVAFFIFAHFSDFWILNFHMQLWKVGLSLNAASPMQTLQRATVDQEWFLWHATHPLNHNSPSRRSTILHSYGLVNGNKAVRLHFITLHSILFVAYCPPTTTTTFFFFFRFNYGYCLEPCKALASCFVRMLNGGLWV